MTDKQLKDAAKIAASEYNSSYYDGFVAGAAYAMNNLWISVKDALPEDCQLVLVREYFRSRKTGRYVNHVKEMYYFEQFGGFELEEKIHRNIGYRITHWMPIPAIIKRTL